MPVYDSDNIVSVPYRPGQSLELEVLENCDDLPSFQSATALISRTFDITMSAVMDVIINTNSGSRIRAVLKLYDRRFGSDLRKVLSNHARLTSEDEAVFQSFVQRGEMTPFLQELEQEMMTEIIPPRPWHQLDDTVEGRVRYEAALWQQCDEFFDCETKAYARLRDIQGKSIPRLYAHVRLVRPSSDVPDELLQQPEVAQYFEIKGVLLELIPGYALRDLDTSPFAPSDHQMWSSIVQSAVDTAHDINRRGVVMNDCGPRNVVVNKDSQHPFIIDLAQCSFQDEIIEEWTIDIEEEGAELKDWYPEVKYWEVVRSVGNHWAIGGVMATRLLNEKGIKLDIKHPDYQKIKEDLKAGEKVV